MIRQFDGLAESRLRNVRRSRGQRLRTDGSGHRGSRRQDRADLRSTCPKDLRKGLRFRARPASSCSMCRAPLGWSRSRRIAGPARGLQSGDRSLQSMGTNSTRHAAAGLHADRPGQADHTDGSSQRRTLPPIVVRPYTRIAVRLDSYPQTSGYAHAISPMPFASAVAARRISAQTTRC